MGAWMTFLKERLPLPSYLVLVMGLAISGSALGNASAAGRPAVATWVATSIAAVGAFLFFAVLRIMDECKDYEKDRVAHPHRPLPRGLLAPEQVAGAVNGLAVAMLVFGVVVGAAAPQRPGRPRLSIGHWLSVADVPRVLRRGLAGATPAPVCGLAPDHHSPALLFLCPGIRPGCLAALAAGAIGHHRIGRVFRLRNLPQARSASASACADLPVPLWTGYYACFCTVYGRSLSSGRAWAWVGANAVAA